MASKRKAAKKAVPRKSARTKSPATVRPRNTNGLKRGGQPGRKKGVPNKATVAGKEIAQGLLARPKYLKSLQEKLDAGKLEPALQVLLWHYAHGKPKETHDVKMPEGARFTLSLNGDRSS